MLKNYFKTAIRNLSKHKIFSFINIFGLAVSLAAVWAIVLFVADELSYDRYHKNADRIYRLVSHGKWDEEKFDITGTPFGAATALKKDYPEIENAVRIDAEGGGIINYQDKTIKENAIFFTDPSFFSVFTYHFIAGNNTALQKKNSIVLTKILAAKFFTNAADALNKTILIDKSPCIITGVIEDVPHNSHFNFNAVRSMYTTDENNWGNLSTYTYLLLKPKADVNQIRAKMPAFVKKYLAASMANVQFNFELQPLTSIHLHSNLSYELGENRNIKYVYILFIAGLLVFIIALINYINITTARASVRLREVAVRKIIGSSRAHLINLFLTESVITILAAALISIVLIRFAMPLFNYVSGKQLSIWQFGMVQSIMYLLAFCFIAALVGGLYPSLFLSKFKTIPALKNQLGNITAQTIFRKSLVTFQFAVTIIMITTSLIIYLQLNYVSKSDLGFNKNQMLTFHIDSREARKKVDVLRAALLQNPLVKSVASAGNPIGNNDIGMMDYNIEKNGALDEHSNLAYGLTIDADFIPAMQIKLLQGRNFSTNIPSDSNSVIVNEAFIKKQGWASGSGKRISRGKDSTGKITFLNIIGVVKDYHIYSLQHAIEPMIMMLPERAEERDNMYVRLSENNLAESLTFIESTFRKFDAAANFDYHFLDKNFAVQYQAEQKQGQLLLVFAILTISIACLGLFGLITFTVNQRIKEIGLRKTLGASVSSLVMLLTRSLLKVIFIAMLIAIPVAWLVINKWLQDFAYRINLEWWMFALAGFVALLIALITLSFQSIKAAVANPVKSLRTE